MQVKQIIDEVVKAVDVKNKSALARELGKDPAILSRAISRNSISPHLADSICVRYPYINRDFLLTGEGGVKIPEIDPENQTKERLITLITDSFYRLSPEVQRVLLESFKRIAAEQGAGHKQG